MPLVLACIIGSLALDFVKSRLHGSHESRIDSTKTEIMAFETALGMFQVDCGHFPTTEEGLAGLMKSPQTVEAARWHGPYLVTSHRGSLKDTWGRAYIYKFPGKHNTNSYDLYSLGPKGKGGDDAIGNWKSPIPNRS
jgi:general secretion pathway protein G